MKPAAPTPTSTSSINQLATRMRERKEGAANHPLVQAVLTKFPGAQIVNVIERAEKPGEDAETEILGEADALAAHEAEDDDDLF